MSAKRQRVDESDTTVATFIITYPEEAVTLRFKRVEMTLKFPGKPTLIDVAHCLPGRAFARVNTNELLLDVHTPISNGDVFHLLGWEPGNNEQRVRFARDVATHDLAVAQAAEAELARKNTAVSQKVKDLEGAVAKYDSLLNKETE